MTNPRDPNPFLPGLDMFNSAGIPPMEQAARKFISVLHQNEVLKPEHVLDIQLVLDLARSIGLSAEKGRASGMALAARELREVQERLPDLSTAGASDEFTEAVNKFLDEQKHAA